MSVSHVRHAFSVMSPQDGGHHSFFVIMYLQKLPATDFAGKEIEK